MPRRNQAQVQFDSLTLESSLLPAEWLAKVAALAAPAQTPADYGVPKGLQLRDEIGRYWRIAVPIWADFAAARAGAGNAVGITHHFTQHLLTHVFGFNDLAPTQECAIDGRVFPLAFGALGGRAPVFVGPYTEDLDQSVPRQGDGSRRRSAWGALQEYLNAADGALWGITTNGCTLRLGRDNASLTRPAWLEADLERIFTEDRFADFSVLWLVLHASRFGRAHQSLHECPLEQWREAGREEGSRARESLRAGVEQALLALGQGFVAHPSNTELRGALASGELTPATYFNELLRLVYRMIFLLTVEERGILHASGSDAAALSLYADGYGMRRLRERALRHAAHDRHIDLWDSLRPVFTGLGRADGEPALALPGLGGLFAAEQCSHIDASVLDNRALLSAVYRLAWMREAGVLARVNWKDMGVEEFGSVYESLLELVPVVSDAGRRFGFAGGAEAAGNERKKTGSYYTPDALVQQLLDTALEPVIASRLAETDPTQPHDVERALLAITVVDPACGSGHFLLAAARRLAGHLARVRSGSTPGATEYRHALRDVITHSIHGVDRNPMALELARMALWLEAYTPDRALGFLDHHLVCGDALLGLLDLNEVKKGIPDEAFNALTGDDKSISTMLKRLNRTARRELEQRDTLGQLPLTLGTQTLADAFAILDNLADDAMEGVEAKRARYSELQVAAASSALALAADCFVGAFLIPKRLAKQERAITEQQARSRFPTTATLAMAIDGTLSDGNGALSAARETCRDARVLHWPLAFPQVFARGGFDVVLGNPPWERIKLQEQEFFAARAPNVARARNKAEREVEIAKLARANEGTPDRAIYDEFLHAKQLAEAASIFCHSDARYPLTGVGDVNTYALFAETMYRLARSSGRAGFIVPSGIATDDSTKAFFGEVANRHLVSLLDFRTGPGLFSEIGHQRFKFCLLTLGSSSVAEFAFSMTAVDQLGDYERRFTLSSDDIRLLNPNTQTCPIFRTEYDAELTKKIYRRVPVLINETKPAAEGNPWGLSFLRMFDMSTDSRLFLDTPAPHTVPLYEAKMIHQFDHRWATYGTAQAPENSARDVTLEEKANANFSARPHYWVAEREVAERLAAHGWNRRWLMGWRRICRSTDDRTLIATVIPSSAIGDSVFLWLMRDADAARSAAFIGAANSLIVDFVTRQKQGGTNLSYYYMRQLPYLPPSSFQPVDLAFICSRILELTYTACDLTSWARDLGFDGEPFCWDFDRRAKVRAELDAYYAHMYGLNRDELRYILDPADVMGPDYPSETFRVLKQNEEREFGEYRTRRLVLDAWDRLFRG